MGFWPRIQMNAEYNDFIALYRDVYPEGYCRHLINEFERLVESGAGNNRQRSENTPKHRKDDLQLGLNFGAHSAADFNNTPATRVFFDNLQRCYDAYTNQFSVLKDNKIIGTAMKMQRTSPGGGYHLWHGEQGNGINADRALVYMLYLNTLTPEEAGETEFLYQQRRIQPQENVMVLWPAAYTHAHRGNVVHGQTSKYIVTGWFYYE
jgi:hypothetical protein